MNSDSLQRHLGLHGEEFKPSPSGRSKRACVVCRASKIKCTGEEPCPRCRKKGIDCEYDQSDPEVIPNSGHGIPPSVIEDPQPSNASIIQHPETPEISAGNEAENINSFADRLSAILGRNDGPINWSAIRIQSDEPTEGALIYPASKDSQLPSDENWPVLSEQETLKYRQAYFTHFHHRWPIIHAPTFDREHAPPVLFSCISMIGACITGTEQAKASAMSLHHRVVDWIFAGLRQVSSEDSFDHASMLGLCQTSLLYIIFGFYCGVSLDLSLTFAE
jgi:hypothetical protein